MFPRFTMGNVDILSPFGGHLNNHNFSTLSFGTGAIQNPHRHHIFGNALKDVKCKGECLKGKILEFFKYF